MSMPTCLHCHKDFYHEELQPVALLGGIATNSIVGYLHTASKAARKKFLKGLLPSGRE